MNSRNVRTQRVDAVKYGVTTMATTLVRCLDGVRGLCVRVQAPTEAHAGNVVAEETGNAKALAATRRTQSTHEPPPVRTLHTVRQESCGSRPTRWVQCSHRGGGRRCAEEANAAATTAAAASVDDRIASAAADEAIASVAAVAAHQRGACPAQYASKTPSGLSANAQSRGLAALTGSAIRRATAACSSLRTTGASPTALQRHRRCQEIHIVRAYTRARPRSRRQPRQKFGLMCGHGATVLVEPLRRWRRLG